MLSKSALAAIFVIALFLLISNYVYHIPSAQIRETETIEYYEVDADNLGGLRRQFSLRGPNGYTGYTHWYVRWDWRCRVSLDTTFTFPKHVNEETLPENSRLLWQQMITKLWLHERAHQHNGRRAAKEILSNRCLFPQSIIQKWALEDALYDMRTDHGRTEGGIWWQK